MSVISYARASPAMPRQNVYCEKGLWESQGAVIQAQSVHPPAALQQSLGNK